MRAAAHLTDPFRLILSIVGSFNSLTPLVAGLTGWGAAEVSDDKQRRAQGSAHAAGVGVLAGARPWPL